MFRLFHWSKWAYPNSMLLSKVPTRSQSALKKAFCHLICVTPFNHRYMTNALISTGLQYLIEKKNQLITAIIPIGHGSLPPISRILTNRSKKENSKKMVQCFQVQQQKHLFNQNVCQREMWLSQNHHNGTLSFVSRTFIVSSPIGRT